MPPNWETAKNETGDIYYFNKVTRETSWTLPSQSTKATPTFTTPSRKQSIDEKETQESLPVPNSSHLTHVLKSYESDTEHASSPASPKENEVNIGLLIAKFPISLRISSF